MKKRNWIIPIIALSSVFWSCSADTPSAPAENPSQSTAAENSVPADEEKSDTGKGVALISIETKNKADNVMDFVEKPVAPHVAADIATWTPNYVMPPAPYYEDCLVTVKDKNDNITIENADAKVKVRGNWTTTYDKKPLRIKFVEKRNMLGLNDGAEMKNWVLLAEYKDGSMLRDKAALEIARGLLEEDGLYASDAEFAEVEINGEYWGMYLLAELQQINPNRVNITEPATVDYAGTDIGYFLEFDGYFDDEPELQMFHVDYADNAPLVPFDGEGGDGREMTCLPEGKGDYRNDIGVTIKNDIISQEQHDFISSFVNNTYKIMYEAAYNDAAYVFSEDYSEIVPASNITPFEAVDKVVNLESLADMYIISEITCDADIYWSSFFMTADFGETGDKKLTFTAPWDFDSAMGNKDRCADSTGLYAANIVPDVNGEYETINPWLAVLMYEDWFTDIIRENWTEAYNSGIFTSACDMIKADTAEYTAAFNRNYTRWNNILKNDAFKMELSKKAKKCRSHSDCSEYLCDWLTKRIDYLNGYWNSTR
ncbi:MAG: CotH kinase family protein [Ruminococcus sp.]|nr:CotH kinase family protein [Ruminococcus sp.]